VWANSYQRHHRLPIQLLLLLLLHGRQVSSPVSIQTQSLALRAVRKRKPQEMQALAFLAVFVYAPQATAFEWKPGFRLLPSSIDVAPTRVDSTLACMLQSCRRGLCKSPACASYFTIS